MVDTLLSSGLGEILGNLILTLIGIIIPMVGAAVVSFLRSKLSASQLQILADVASMAVQAAEQGKIGGFVTNKKASAINAASALLASRGIKVSPEALDAAIEAAVLATINRPIVTAQVYAKAEAAGLAARAA